MCKNKRDISRDPPKKVPSDAGVGIPEMPTIALASDAPEPEIDEERRDSSNQSARAFRRPWAPFLMLPPSHGPSPGGRGRSTTSDRETGHCVLRASATSLSSWLPQTRCGSASSGTSRSLRTPGAVLQLRSDLQRLLVGSIDKNVFFTTSSPSQSYSASLETSQTGVSA